MLHCPRRQRVGVGHFYYDDEEHRSSVNKPLTKDEARRIAADVAEAAGVTARAAADKRGVTRLRRAFTMTAPCWLVFR